MRLARAAILAGLLWSVVGLFAPAAGASAAPEIKHLFTIVLENKDAEQTFSSSPPSWYLGKTMPAEGALVPNYFGIGHNSLVNYIAMISGQPPNLETQAQLRHLHGDAPGRARLRRGGGRPGLRVPPAVTTVAGQLEAAGRSWRAYMQDMANSVGAGAPATCRHPALGAQDEAETAGPERPVREAGTTPSSTSTR